MKSYFLIIIKKYLQSYYGLSKHSWHRVLLNFMVSTLSGIFYFLSFYFVNFLHINVATSGYIISCYGLGAILGGLIGGKLSDNIPPEWVSMISLFLLACAYLTLTKVKFIPLLMIDLFIIGITAYGFITANHLSVLNNCETETERLKSIGMLSVASNLGLGLSALIVSSLSSYGFIYIFLLVSFLLFAIGSYLFFNNIKSFYKTKIYSSVLIKNNTETILQKKSKASWLVLACVLSIGAIVAQSSTTYSIYIQSNFPKLGIKAVSILFSLNSFLVVFFQTPITHFFKNVNKILLVGVGSFLLGLGMFFLNFAFIFLIPILGCIIYTMGEMLFFSAAQFVCYQKGGKKKGYSLGLYRMVYATSRIIGPGAGGMIYHRYGPATVWCLSGIIGLICLTACNYFKKYA